MIAGGGRPPAGGTQHGPFPVHRRQPPRPLLRLELRVEPLAAFHRAAGRDGPLNGINFCWWGLSPTCSYRFPHCRRLFREFAVTLSVTIVVSAVVSLTLTPMMASRLLRHTPEGKQDRFYQWSEHMFERIIAFYGRTLRFALRFQPVVIALAAATLVLSVYLFIVIPKGFFPIQDTGVGSGDFAGPRCHFFAAMSIRQRALARVILQDPAVESLSSFIGVDGTNTTLNSGRMQINLKPLADRRVSASDVIRRLKPKVQHVTGIELFMQPVQDLTVEDRVSRTQFQYTLEDPNEDELNTWTNKLVAELRKSPQIEDVATDQMPLGNAIQINIDNDDSRIAP